MVNLTTGWQELATIKERALIKFSPQTKKLPPLSPLVISLNSTLGSIFNQVDDMVVFSKRDLNLNGGILITWWTISGTTEQISSVVVAFKDLKKGHVTTTARFDKCESKYCEMFYCLLLFFV